MEGKRGRPNRRVRLEEVAKRCGVSVSTASRALTGVAGVREPMRAAINGLAAESRSGAVWHYVLLGEDTFYNWRDKGGSMAELMAYAKLRPVAETTQQRFAF